MFSHLSILLIISINSFLVTFFISTFQNVKSFSTNIINRTIQANIPTDHRNIIDRIKKVYIILLLHFTIYSLHREIPMV